MKKWYESFVRRMTKKYLRKFFSLHPEIKAWNFALDGESRAHVIIEWWEDDQHMFGKRKFKKIMDKYE